MRRVQFPLYFLFLGLAACGGSGGDGDSVSAGTTNNFPPQTPLVYAGATTAASVSASSAGVIASNVLGASGASAGGGVVAGVNAQSSSSEQPTGAAGIMRRLSSAIRSSDLTAASGSAMAGAAIDSTKSCDSGTVRVSGTLADNGTGTVNVAYNDCRTGSDTINGPASLRIDGYDQVRKVITDGTLTITRVNFSGPGMNIGFTGTLRAQIDKSAQTEQLTSNIVAQDNNTQRMSRTDNLVIVDHFDDVFAKTFYTESISGRVYDGTAGYVDVSTQTAPYTDPWGPLYYSTTTQSFPDWGIIVLSGATSSVRITAFGHDLAKLEVDSNGDGLVDATARMPWSAFNTAIGSDLADSDGDGMHNSFETFYGLNPNNPADVAADSDGDGFSNMTEYLAGSSPATNGSVPAPVRHLWVTGNRDLAVDANGQIQVFVGGTGSGVLLDPVTRELGATFSGAIEPNGAGNTTVTDSQGRTFTLAPTAVPTTYTLTSSTGGTLTITGVAGTDPGSLIRYGAHGLAFRTLGASGAGYIYLVESAALVP